ncbi:NAD-dependent epimerase/dehydratase family protein [Vibrio cholerae]|uniref:NAD-dependent epimerase/dehydratase family protein n=1 Tax=Vibrio cholerae TaxID=666 RepID=UPI0004E36366|nr:NAD-dependent epimerase/dehydratase family protein [Vibrio cholerae]EGR1088992.1 NAD-dependent epimerase/dehydratase family protein [Vibrio cholerae]KFE23497.1 rmlD substrate binding domain protein [Vibrio cholerae]TXZ28696.1 NAD-dependent epimerase/dehydratase family protein [Vibrio cholerae]BCK27007.1 GDP-L-colitose synthase [Vibrio cholerae]BCN21477.1 GDP-L-colitose synthase [Vibrio cholerae]
MFDKSKKILITGSSGVLGTALKEQLLRQGYKNILAPNSSELNLTNLKSTKLYIEKNQPEHIYHLASLVYGLKGNLNNQFNAISTNSTINNNLFLAIHNSTVSKVFFAGTVASYPYPYKSLPLKEDDFLNGEPHKGEYGYASAKRFALSYLKLMKEYHNIDYCYGIFTNLYGKNDKFDLENGHVIPSLIEKAFNAVNNGTKTVEVWGNVKTSRDFMYSDDAARAAILAMNNFSGLVNISSGKETTISDVILAINNSFSGELNFIFDKNAPIGVSNRSVDNSRLKEAGFFPEVSIDDGISRVITWYRENERIIRR